MKISLTIACAMFLAPLPFIQALEDNRTLAFARVFNNNNNPAAHSCGVCTKGTLNKHKMLLESNLNGVHKYYLSVSNVTYSSKANALQMTTRFFIDDLEHVLSERTDKKIVLHNNEDLNNQKARIAAYLERKLEVRTDGSARSTIYLGGEIENDQVIFYIEIPVTQQPTSISMKFTALQELFEDQKNMVHLKINGQRGTLLMTKDKQTDFLKLI